jgi:hypothetical protein
MKVSMIKLIFKSKRAMLIKKSIIKRKLIVLSLKMEFIRRRLSSIRKFTMNSKCKAVFESILWIFLITRLIKVN